MNQPHRTGGTPPGPRRFLILTAVALIAAILGYGLLVGLLGSDTPQGDASQQAGTLLPEDALAPIGEEIAHANCASCHAIGRAGESPNESAPPFREFHNMWPVEHLEEALAEGIMVGHAEGMPEYQFEPDQIAHFIAYLKTLEE